MALSYRIHPAIGVARVGSSTTGWFIGSEAPGAVPDQSDSSVATPPNGKYKTGAGATKRQGARFRIYEYDDSSGTPTPVREITSAEATINWSVTLGNRKASSTRIFDKGNRNAGVADSKLNIEASGSINANGANPVNLEGSFQARHFEPKPVPLGDLRVDANGRLIVLGGFGKSFSPTNRPIHDTFNNDDWCDDTSDGPVTAKIVLNGSQAEIEPDPAWVLVGPPDFAPHIRNIISLYDIVYDACLTKFGVHLDPLLAQGRVLYSTHVYPLLKNTVDTYWVDNTAVGIFGGHGPGQGGDFLQPAAQALLSNNTSNPASPESQARNRVFNKLRDPSGGGGNMPRLKSELDSGRRPRLADWHYDVMEKWANGNFESVAPTAPAALDALPLAEQPFALDKSSLNTCVGASFYPGIEGPRIFREEPDIYRSPFRIVTGLSAGELTAGLALPWQTDFLACGSGWWPAQRPNDVFRSGSREQWDEGGGSAGEFVDRWKLLGFVVPSTGQHAFEEQERDI